MDTVLPIPAFKDNYIWLVFNKNGQALIVDPGDATPVLNYLKKEQIKPAAILVTHHHQDHCGGVAEITQQYPIPVYAPKNEPVTGATHGVVGDEIIELPGFTEKAQVLSIPAHTRDHVAYLIGNKLFCGDTLFSAGCGRIFEGTPEQLYLALKKINELPSATQIFCGHEYTVNNLKFAAVVEPNNTAIRDYFDEAEQLCIKHLPTLPSTLARERLVNPFLRIDEPDIIQSVEQHVGNKLTTPVAVLAALRQWKNEF